LKNIKGQALIPQVYNYT